MGSVFREVYVQRNNQLDIKFNGLRIGFGSNRSDDREKWMEITLYERDDGRLVAVKKTGGIGLEDYYFTEEADTPKGLLKKLSIPDRRSGGRQRFIHPAIKQAFTEAAKVNKDFESALVIDYTTE